MRLLPPLLTAALVAIVGCSPDQGPVVPTGNTGGVTVRLAAVGDSITEADSPDFSSGRTGPESWVHHVIGDGVALAGGWARWGATTQEMANAVEPVTADVLVIMAGTNDAALGVPLEQVVANLESIAATIGAPEVILASIPPIDHSPEVAADFNRDLEGIARERGWLWVDSGGAVRTVDGVFAPGTASDGVHPTRSGAELIGGAISQALEGLRTDL